MLCLILLLLQYIYICLYNFVNVLKGSLEDSIIRQGGSGLRQYRPYYSFFPPAAMVQIDRATTITMANCNGGEVGGHVDLNLKL